MRCAAGGGNRLRMTVMAAALHVGCVAYAICPGICLRTYRSNRSGSRSVTHIEGRCIPATTGAGCIVTPCAALRERCSRLRRSPRLPPRASKAAPRGPLRRAQGAACHVLCVRRRAPQELATLEGRPPRTAGFAVAAAKLRPTVAVIGEARVVGEVTAATGHRQAARGRAFTRPQLRRDRVDSHIPSGSQDRHRAGEMEGGGRLVRDPGGNYCVGGFHDDQRHGPTCGHSIPQRHAVPSRRRFQ